MVIEQSDFWVGIRTNEKSQENEMKEKMQNERDFFCLVEALDRKWVLRWRKLVSQFRNSVNHKP